MFESSNNSLVTRRDAGTQFSLGVTSEVIFEGIPEGRGTTIRVDGPVQLIGMSGTVEASGLGFFQGFAPTVDDVICSVCIDRRMQLTYNRDWGVGGFRAPFERYVTLGALSTKRWGRFVLVELDENVHDIEVMFAPRVTLASRDSLPFVPAVATLELLFAVPDSGVD